MMASAFVQIEKEKKNTISQGELNLVSLLRVQHTSSYRYNAGYCPFESTLLLLSSNSGRETMFGCCWVSCRFLCEEAVSQCWIGDRPLLHPKKTNVLPPNGQQSRTAISDPYRLSSDGRHFLFVLESYCASLLIRLA